MAVVVVAAVVVVVAAVVVVVAAVVVVVFRPKHLPATLFDSTLVSMALG